MAFKSGRNLVNRSTPTGALNADEGVPEDRELDVAVSIFPPLRLAPVAFSRLRIAQPAAVSLAPIEHHVYLDLLGKLARQIGMKVGMLARDDEQVLGHEVSL